MPSPPSFPLNRTRVGQALPLHVMASPLPWGEGGPRPAFLRAGAGRVRGHCQMIAFTASNLFKTNPAGTARRRCGDLAVRSQAILRMYTPMVTALHARDRWVRLHLDEHRFGTKQVAYWGGLRSGFSHNQASPFAARNRARLTATRASCTL